MVVFKRKPKVKTRDYKLVGAALPSWVHVYMSLYSVAKSTSITAIVRVLVNRWLEEQKVREPEKILIKQIIKRGQALWKYTQEEDPEISLEDFLINVKEDLKSRGIPDAYISIIINGINGTN